MRLPVLRPMLAAASILLAGCGAAVKQPPVPLDQPLLPATVYVAECPHDEGVFGALDRAPGAEVCASMRSAMDQEARAFGDAVRVVTYKPTPGAPRFTLTPDAEAEAANHSRYRVVMMAAWSSRQNAPVAGGTLTTLGISQPFAVVDIVSGSNVGQANLSPAQGGENGASEMARKLLAGLRGHRCEVLNRWSFAGAVHNSFGGQTCETYTLRPLR